MAFDHVRHVQFATDPAEFIAATLEMLGPFEERQYFFVRPTAVAELRPSIVVQRLAPDVEHAVDGA